MAVAACLMCSCEKSIPQGVYDEDTGVDVTTADGLDAKMVRFDMGGWQLDYTRATSVGESDMTDIWVFDIVDGIVVQRLHQTAGDASWGSPVLTLPYGEHRVCFIASRGLSPTVSEDDQTIVWDSPRDTYWQSIELDVSPGTSGSHAVLLNRVVTRLRLSVLDEVPEDVSYINVEPDRWYYGIEFATGRAADMREHNAREIAVPVQYLGTTGLLTLSVTGMSDATEWTTNVSVTACDADDNILGSAVLSGTPFIRNRSTNYSGSLFSAGGTFTLTLNDGWADPYQGSW